MYTALQLANERATQIQVRERTIRSANVSDVLIEQLEYLIAHTASGFCGCDDCERYLRVKAPLLEVFQGRSV